MQEKFHYFLKIDKLTVRAFCGKNFSFKSFKLFCYCYYFLKNAGLKGVGGGVGSGPPDPLPGSATGSLLSGCRCFWIHY